MKNKKTYPQRTTQHAQGAIGASAFQLFVERDLQWQYRPVHQESDFGIDGYIDLVEGGRVLGIGLAVQIKCGNSYLRKQSDGELVYEGEIKHLNFYQNLRLPVVFVILDANGDNGFWTHFDLSKVVPKSNEELWYIEVPPRNKLNKNVKSKWRQLAGPIVDVTETYKNESNKYRLHSICTNLLVRIRKNDVVFQDIDSLFRWQAQITKARGLMLDKRCKVDFWFDGWLEDPRELWQIPEVRSFVSMSIDAGFPWLYWLEPDLTWQGYRLLFSCGCNIKSREINGKFEIQAYSAEDLKIWMTKNFHALNNFTEMNRIPESINHECSDNLGRFLRQSTKYTESRDG